MTREEFITKIDERVKLIRNEKGFTQDKMAGILGISKKTLIQVEKERASLGWTTAVAVCAIFKDSEILQMTFGDGAQDIILSLAFNHYEKPMIPTMGGKIWWIDIQSKGSYRIQQNVISKHYRILDKKEKRVCFSFDLDYLQTRLRELGET